MDFFGCSCEGGAVDYSSYSRPPTPPVDARVLPFLRRPFVMHSLVGGFVTLQASRPSGGGDSVSAAKPVNGAGTSFNKSSASASSSSYSKPAASSYSKPATASSSRPASGRVGGGAAGSTGGAKLPSAGSLRSSGHNLW